MRKIAILGLGLIGGSLGLAVRRANLAEQVVGYDAKLDTLKRARERGAITHICVTPEEAAQQADMVVLATPVLAMYELMGRIAPVLKPGTLVTDAASTKAEVTDWAKILLPPEVTFVGGHPMSGRERSGIEAAEVELFEGCVYCLTPTVETPSAAIARLIEFVTRLGAHPLVLDAEKHDRLVAGISHLPFVLSTALVQMLGIEEDWPEMAGLAAGGYRDMSRLAAGSPIMHRDICMTNREALLDWLDALELELERVRRLITAGDAALEAYFVQAKQIRDAWPLHRATLLKKIGEEVLLAERS